MYSSFFWESRNPVTPYKAVSPVKLEDAWYPVQVDKLWFQTWLIDPVKLDKAEFPVKLDEAVCHVKLDEAVHPVISPVRGSAFDWKGVAGIWSFVGKGSRRGHQCLCMTE